MQPLPDHRLCCCHLGLLPPVRYPARPADELGSKAACRVALAASDGRISCLSADESLGFYLLIRDDELPRRQNKF